MLARNDLRRLLGALGDELAAEGVRGDLFIVGGAVMALAYNTRRSTRDIDGVFEPKQMVYDAARRVAARHPDLPDDWLNDAVKGFLLGDDPEATVTFDHPGLRVRVASPRYLFTMKVVASRVERDTDDIAALYRLAGFTSVHDALGYVEQAYPHLKLEPKVLYLLEELAADSRLARTGCGNAADPDACGKIVRSTGLPCRLDRTHGGRCRSR